MKRSIFKLRNVHAGDDFFCGTNDELPGTLEVKKLNNGRCEFKVSGDMMYNINLQYPQLVGVYPASVYFKSKEYKGPGKTF